MCQRANWPKAVLPDAEVVFMPTPVPRTHLLFCF